MTKTETKAETLLEITETFGEAYSLSKDSEKTMKQYQKKFFDAATDTLAGSLRPQKVIDIPEDANAQEWVSRYHPGWNIIPADQDVTSDLAVKDGQVLIEQDPAVMKFTFVNEQDGKVYGRTVAEGKAQLDDELLRERDPDLWERITEWSPDTYALIEVVLKESHADIEARWWWINGFCERHGVPRVLKDPATLPPEDFDAMAQYVVPGPLTVRLVPPRPATDEELDGE